MSFEHSSNVTMKPKTDTQEDSNFEETSQLSDFSIENCLNELPNFTIEELLDLDIPKNATYKKQSDSEDDDMFGSDEELVHALEDDPFWDIGSAPPKPQQNDDIELANKHDSVDNDKLHRISEEPSKSQQNEEDKDDFMADIEIPEISNDRVVSMDNTDVPEMSKDHETSVDNIDTYMSHLDPFNNDTMENTLDSTERQDTIFPMTKDVSMDLINEDTDICSQKLQSLDLMESDTTQLSPREESSEQQQQAETILMEQFSVPSTTQTSSMPARSSRSAGISLRKRNAIQLQPFTFESAQFNKLLGRIPAKSKLKETLNIAYNADDDDSDTDFTPLDTQRVDEPIDEIPTQELESLGVIRGKSASSSKATTKKSVAALKNPPSSTSSRVPESSTNSIALSSHAESSRSESISSSEVEVRQDTSERPRPALIERMQTHQPNIKYPEELSKYGLGKLILPPSTNRVREKKKVITFSTKKKGSKRKERTFASSQHTEVPNKKDIFSFDLNPKAVPKPLPTVIEDTESLNESENESDEEVVFRHPRLKKRKVLIDDDSEEEEEEQEKEVRKMTEEELNRIFDFPREPLVQQRIQREGPIKRNVPRNLVSIVEDEFEYRDQKRQRMNIRDLQARNLKNVLPASYLKLNEKELEEERRNPKLAKPMKATAASSSVVRKDKSHTTRNAEDVFALFREDSDEDGQDNERVELDTTQQYDNGTIRVENSVYYDDDDESIMDYGEGVEFEDDCIMDYGDTVDYGDDHSAIDYNENDEMEYEDTTRHHGIIDRRVSRGKIDRYFIPEYNCRSNTTRVDPSNLNNDTRNASNSSYIPNTTVDASQAMEFNRISRHGTHTTGNNHGIQSTSSSRRPAASSAIKTKPVNNNNNYDNAGRAKSMGRKDNSKVTGSRNNNSGSRSKQKRRPRRTVDDIYVHKPYYTSYAFDKRNTGMNEESNRNWWHENGRREEVQRNINQDNSINKRDLPRRAFDDIYMNTTRQSMVYKGTPIYIGSYDITDYLKRHVFNIEPVNERKPLIYSLDSVIQRIEKLKVPNIRHIIGLRNTVYLHHELMAPLISKNPKGKHKYDQFKETHSDLILFEKRYYWKQINGKQTFIIKDLFSRIFQDLFHLCSNDEYSPKLDINEDVEGHDYSYTFISICLSLWVPLLSNKEKSELVSLFTYHVRGLALAITKLAEIRDHVVTKWKPIVKILIYLLDWTCRLELLEMDRSIWSVTEFSQVMMDILVYIGYDLKEDYLIEAWICLILIVVVSNGKYGYRLNKQVFLNQMMYSIQHKSRELNQYEYKKRRTIMFWANSLDNVLSKHLLLQ